MRWRVPPFVGQLAKTPAPLTDLSGARVLAVLGDSVTTDHISPAGSIPADSPAGRYLIAQGVPPHDFNSYGARRGKTIGTMKALSRERPLDLVDAIPVIRPCLCCAGPHGAGTGRIGPSAQSLLFGVGPHDPVTCVTAARALIGSAAVASYLPARRASRVDPVEALKAE